MFLSQLVSCYDRLVEDGRVPPSLWFKSTILHGIIVIDNNGRFIGFINTKDGNSYKKAYVPSVERTRDIKPGLLSDNSKYLLGHYGTVERKQKFIDRLKDFAQDSGLAVIRSVIQFYEEEQDTNVLNSKEFSELVNNLRNTQNQHPKPNLAFSVEDTKPLTDKPDVIQAVTDFQNQQQDSAGDGVCAITGKRGPIARTHGKISKINARLVNFNEPAYCSYGKKQGENCPISIEAEQKYVTTYSTLAEEQSVLIGNTRLVFWTSKDHPAEDALLSLFGGKDSVISESEYLRRLLKSACRGTNKPERTRDDIRYHILAAENNQHRLAVTSYNEGSIDELERNISQHLNDVAVEAPCGKGEKHVRHFTISNLLFKCVYPHVSNCAYPKDESARRTRHMQRSMIESVVNCLPYPKDAYRLALSSVPKTVRDLNRDNLLKSKIELAAQIAVLKGFINRNSRSTGGTPMSVGLDPKNEDPYYVSGRVFAILEYIQTNAVESKSGIVSVFDKASRNPARVMPSLYSRCIKGHLSKLFKQKTGLAVNCKKYLGRTIEMIGGEFPVQATEEQRGKFMVGYQNQNMWLYTRKENRDNTWIHDDKLEEREKLEELGKLE